MTKITEIKTERLLMRQWREEDLFDFWLLNSDPEVMEYLPEIPSEEDSNILAEKIIKLIARNGWGFWAIETLNDNSFIGFVGLNEPKYELPVNPCVEVGWRLARKYWGNGYATEAGNASLDFAFDNLNVNEIYSFTSVANKKSQAVMERLNMINTHSNFNHPTIPDDSPYREHVLYKIDKENWSNEKYVGSEHRFL
ncbi:MAG: GNAT family N-acetyltransferase [Gammaproteobacteria bacterium]|nr:GNAT family N-acetyltransferase [Gammaproteobacteria bacterium]